MDTMTRTTTTKRGQVSYGEHGSGPSIAFFHSLLTDRTAFEPVLDGLAGRALLFDLPGFGATAPETDLDGFADSMAAAITSVCDDETRVTVVGNGLGAFVALGLAARHPDLVGKLLLVGCGATFPEEARPAFGNMAGLVEENGMEAVTPIALRRIFTEEYLSQHPEAAAERGEVLARTEPTAFMTACLALRSVDFTEQAPSIDMPVLIVVGDRDAATPPAMAEELDSLLPNSRMVTLPGIAHAPQLQDPPGFLEAVVDFLEES